MATKKTRKRAYIPPSQEVANRRERVAGHASVRPGSRAATGRNGTPYPVPSLRRTLRRLPIYFGLIFALQFYLLGTGKELSAGERLQYAALQAGLVTLCFAPFMHMMDRFAYNRFLKRGGQSPAAKD